MFDATGLEEKQFEATSSDGTKIPYFVVCRKDMKCDGSQPTILYGYVDQDNIGVSLVYL